MKFHLDQFVRLPSVTFIVPGRTVLLELGGAALVFHNVSPISCTVISRFIFTNQLQYECWKPTNQEIPE